MSYYLSTTTHNNHNKTRNTILKIIFERQAFYGRNIPIHNNHNRV